MTQDDRIELNTMNIEKKLSIIINHFDCEESHDWYCGCGHWNGCNLAICALCGRTPSESCSIKKVK
jgi:hypothetical protein